MIPSACRVPDEGPAARPWLRLLAAALLPLLAGTATPAQPEDAGPDSEERVPVRGTVVARETGSPLENVSVTVLTLTAQGIGDPVARTRTDAEGAFEFADLEDGRYALRTEMDGRALDLRALDVTGEEPEDGPPTIELALALAIRGQVVDTRTNQPIPGARVSCLNRRTTTDEAGHFTLDRLPQGQDSYDLAVQKRGHVPRSTSLGQVRTPVHEGVLVLLEEGRKARFTVRDVGGKPLSGASVLLRFFREDPYSPFRSFFEADTDDGGRCTIGGLAYDSPFVAEVRLDGYPPHQTLPLWTADEGTETEIVLARNAGVTGVVRDTAGKPVAGATVTVMRLVEPLLSFGGPDPDREDKGFLAVTTDDEGSFSLSDLARGEHRIRVDAEGYEIYEAVVRPTTESGAARQALTLLPQVACRRRIDTDEPGIAWCSGVDVAFDRARRENRPVFLAMAMDDEPANDGIAVMHFKNPELITLTRYTYPLLSTAFDHTPEDDPDGLDERYGAQPSSVFQEVEVWARNLIGGGQVVNVPRHIFFDPERRILFQRTLWLTERDLRRMIVRSLRRVNPEDAVLLANRMYHQTLSRCRSDDPVLRDEALHDLIILATVGDELAGATLGHLDPGLFSDAALIAGFRRMGSGIHEFHDVVAPGLDHDNPLVRREAALALVRGGSLEDLERALPRLAATRDRDVEKVLLSGYSVTRKGSRLDFSGARDHPLGARVAILYAKMGQRDAQDVVLDLLASEDPETRVDCAYAAAKIGTAQCLNALLAQLEKGGTRAAIMARALGEARDQRAAPFLMLALKDSSWILREEAARALGKLRVDTTAPILEPLLEDPKLPVRIAAAEALHRLGHDEGLFVLLEALDRNFYRDRAEAVLEAAYSAAQPLTRNGWSRWIRSRTGTGDESDAGRGQ